MRRSGAVRSERTEHAPRLAGRAERRADVHQRLVPVGGTDGAAGLWQQLFGERMYGVTWRSVDAVDDAAEHAIDVRVQHRDGLAERKRGDGSGSVGTDAGKLAELSHGARQLAAVMLHHNPRELVQSHGASVVAHAGPEANDVGRLGVGQRPEGGERFEEGVVLRDDALDLGLLEHHFRDEDGIRVGDAAPGEDAGVARVPGGSSGVEGVGVDHRATRP